MIICSKYRSTITLAEYPSILGCLELAGPREVEQEGMTITNKLTGEKGIIFPLSFGEAAYAVPIFDLK
jgi:hypothetical protein